MINLNLQAVTGYISDVIHGRDVFVGNKKARWTKVRDLKVGAKIAVKSRYGGNDRVEFEEIVSIKAVGRERVWDIEVEGARNFVGNGILAHNTYLRGTIGTTSVASVSGTSSFANLVVDQSGVGDIFTASVSGAPKVTILNSGDVNIVNLSTNGTVYSNNGTLTNVNPSSQEYKSNITGVNLDAERLLGLTVKKFNWNENGQEDFGLIAEEIREAVPELYMEQNGIKGYRQDHMAFYLLQIAQSQKVKIDNIEEDISGVVSELAQVKTDVAILQDEMASVSARLAKTETDISLAANLSNLTNWTNWTNLEEATISGDLKVLGLTELAKTNIGGELTVGLLHFDDLKASISSLTGLVTIDGDLRVAGDATISGKLRVENGVEMKDQTTGETYCLTINNGETVKKKGNCE